ncbi:MAG: discoidin domain-containing protein [Acidobacteriota bacterium]|nr:discoidin domain-containing protein [Acidobacteriota bacterium]MDQ5872166.1 discoidin domain-containing protein [Acidobacteriota bacterium]
MSLATPRAVALALLLGIGFGFAGVPRDDTGVLDDFEDVSRWKAVPSDGVSLTLAPDAGFCGRALRMDFDFHGRSGWAAARRPVPLEMPENWELSFRLRADAPVNNLEFKLVDESGENVWWVNRRNFEFPRDWQKVTIKKRHVEFAWGPAGGGELERVAAIEITVTAGSGGKGSVWVDELTFAKLPPARPYARTPSVTASSAIPGHEPGRVLDGDVRTGWLSEKTDSGAWLMVDFLEEREYGGLMLSWAPPTYVVSYRLETSDDGLAWTTVRTVTRGARGRDYLSLPESESRFLRLRLDGGMRSFGLQELRVEPLEFSVSKNAFFSAIAKESPRGAFPRGFPTPRGLAGQQVYWTVVGVDGDREEGLFSEDGALEVGKGGFTVEPFVFGDGTLLDWSDVETAHSLAQGELPIPSVTWRRVGVMTLEATAFAAGDPGASALFARYRLRNVRNAPISVRLFLALRAFQVNPPTQFLNVQGGSTRVRSIRWDGAVADVDRKRVLPFPRPSAFGAATFDEGDVTEYLHRAELPASHGVTDPFGHASAAFAWDLDLGPGEAKDVDVVLPLHPESRPATGAGAFDRALEQTTRTWREKLDRLSFTLPASAQALARTAKTALAHVLINRDGPGIQPGSRSYERSWIRDGALTSAALLRLGHPEPVRQFIEWFAPYQYDSGKIPCCVDARGADPVPENDSHGEFLYLVAEYGRFTGDRELLGRLWPRVAKTVAYIDRLRQERRTPAYRRPGKLAFFGLLPESISHEGYSAKAVHSYWDDFFALTGLKDAAEIAAMLGKEEQRRSWEAMATEFRRDLYASIGRTISERRIDFIPGSVELADFDATSTTIALDPGGELENLPRRELLRTFERYYEEFQKRKRPGAVWDAYTPYEIRTVGTFVRLGWRDRAHELLDFFLDSRRPAGWNQWAEVVGREPRRARFIGDMPHTWVGSDYVRSFLDLFAYERESDKSLVLAAGIREDWISAPGGVGVRGLRTRHGTLDYSLGRSEGEVRMDLSGDLEVPAGGLVLSLPEKLVPRDSRATVNGRAAARVSGEIVIRELPARVIWIAR